MTRPFRLVFSSGGVFVSEMQKITGKGKDGLNMPKQKNDRLQSFCLQIVA
jgi:hypothetical protein